MQFDLILKKIGWHIVPILVLVVGGFFLIRLFLWAYNRLPDDKNLKRVVFALYFALTAVFLSLVISSYRSDAKWTVRPKISQIEQVQAKAERKEKELQKLKKQLDKEISVANNEKWTTFDPTNKPSQIITAEWLAKNRAVIDSIPDESVKKSYTTRFNEIENYFFPKNQ
ncbi:hypothetical protein N2F86_12465 [Enterococcus faecium]|nr:hypothetical protein [Enterococcus faecium]MCU1831683.1 hypothetical protein [Enterococcus faecium]MCU1834380.1 hypothetical protein [Enterococcus faecium]MCU1853063.1 hypothetical protein [Enterococcus faecium]MCU1878204.1 hypothetical protein [Enterococcus faecium]